MKLTQTQKTVFKTIEKKKNRKKIKKLFIKPTKKTNRRL
jgi:hypothetical protein